MQCKQRDNRVILSVSISPAGLGFNIGELRGSMLAPARIANSESSELLAFRMGARFNFFARLVRITNLSAKRFQRPERYKRRGARERDSRTKRRSLTSVWCRRRKRSSKENDPRKINHPSKEPWSLSMTDVVFEIALASCWGEFAAEKTDFDDWPTFTIVRRKNCWFD